MVPKSIVNNTVPNRVECVALLRLQFTIRHRAAKLQKQLPLPTIGDVRKIRICQYH